MTVDQYKFGELESVAGIRGVDAGETDDQPSLVHFFESHGDQVKDHLRDRGAVLLRGFGIQASAELEAAMQSLGGGILEYSERSSPRTQVSGRVYTSTDYPAHQRIFLHNENSYATTWPQWIAFCCFEAAEEGGETPIADVERVEERIAEDLKEEFARKGIRYLRNYGGGLGLDWQEAFQTDDPAAVDALCSRTGIRVRWNGEQLRTEWEAPAWVYSNVRERPVWFNHAAFFHVSTLPDELKTALRSIYSEDALPTNTFFGDGSPIPDEAVAHLRQAYELETLTFKWGTGDVLLLDNMRFAHGRSPFRGSRKVVVCMAEPISRFETGAIPGTP